jgi:Ca2+/Na+ antiporter
MSRKRALNYLWQRNPVTRVLYARADRGLKIIALSLMVVLATALPYGITASFGWAASHQAKLAWLFAVGAAIAHVGFVLGLALLIYDRLWKR